MLAGALAAALGAAAAGPWTGVGLADRGGHRRSPACSRVISIWWRGPTRSSPARRSRWRRSGLPARSTGRRYGAAGAGLDLPTFGPVTVPGLARLPVIGPGLFSSSRARLTWPCCRSRWSGGCSSGPGWGLRAPSHRRGRRRRVRPGSGPAGSSRRRCSWAGAFAGVAGATLVLAQVGTFAERMTAGRGFIAIAIVVLGRWHPVGVAARGTPLRRGDGPAVRLSGDGAGRAVPALPDAALRPHLAGPRRGGRPGAGPGRIGARAGRSVVRRG